MSDQQSPEFRDYSQQDSTAQFDVGEVQRQQEFVGEQRLTSADQAMVDALRPGTALLIAMRGPNAGARFLLDDAEVSTGRHPDSDIFLDDVTVSRRHALFRRGERGYAVQDVGSLNGTYVNGEVTDHRELQTGDEVQVGKFRLVYYGASAAS
ncbi:FHA domain-containing protein [Calidifontibacter sp. DB0510]|uniref:FHA domain-containing protein n=1 Tax=Metallococcus carri TaxID=1656884 RepID=A0A967AXC3_9MICO|nr:FHA domain-containing protein [Metallococcus carri]NHN54711.1 FHA domain-containing protein [Metallococcus carri]NOP37056.1 FHA domain-containing protein [Calidifontibacter sp. DB2511S]